MKPYYQDEWVTQYCSDALSVLKELESDSVDLLCTDPPYGIGFMGKSWDKALPDKRIWVECLRVLKPGSFAFVMSIPRQDCLSRMIISLEDVGFRVNFTPIYWAYASGFPKAQNMGKAVDKRMGAERKVVGQKTTGRANAPRSEGRSYVDCGNGQMEIDITQPSTPQAKALDGSYGGFQPKPAVEVIIVAMKPLSEKTFVDQALKNRKGITWLDDCRIPYERNEVDFNARQRQQVDMAERGWTGNVATPGTDIQMFKQAGRFPANLLTSDRVLDYNKVWMDEENTPIVESDLNSDRAGIKAKAKPLAMPLFTEDLEAKRPNGELLKPLKENQNPQNINEPYQKQGSGSMTSEGESPSEVIPDGEPIIDGVKQSLKETGISAESAGIGERIIGAKDSTPITSKPLPNTPNSSTKSPTESPFASPAIERQRTSDARDNFSRFFSLDSWWNERVKQLTKSQQRTYPFAIISKASKSEKNKGLDTAKRQKIFNGQSPNSSVDMKDVEERFTTQPTRNHHPTVKPLKLMSYLITLGSREGDVVLDPFLGSGTTALASKLLGRKCIGIEINEEYCEIASKRCSQQVFNFGMTTKTTSKGGS